MPITGYISIGLPLGPNDETDPVFITDPKYGLGGLRTLGTTAERDSIVDARRQLGMVVYVSDVNKYYSLLGGTGNEHWTIFNSASSSGLTSYISSFNGKTGDVRITSGRGILVNTPIVIGLTSYIQIDNTWGELDTAAETLKTLIVTSLNGLTGDVTIPLATTGTSAGIASFDPDYFNVSLTAQVTVKTGIKAGNLIVLGVSSVFGAGQTGSLPALDGSKLLEVNAKLLDGKTREQITDGGYFVS